MGTHDATVSTIPIAGSSMRLAAVLSDMRAHPALSPLTTGTLLEMPCCGTRVDAEGILCGESPSTVYWPPRWQCPTCDRVWTVDDFDRSKLADIAGRTMTRCERCAGTGWLCAHTGGPVAHDGHECCRPSDCPSANGCPDCNTTGQILAQAATRPATTGRVPDSHHELLGDRANAAGQTSGGPC